MKARVGDLVMVCEDFSHEGTLGIVMHEEEYYYDGQVMLANGETRNFGAGDVTVIAQCAQEVS